MTVRAKRVMDLDHGGIKYRGTPTRESYAVKLRRHMARQANQCPGITKKGEPCKREWGKCPWHEVDG